MLPSQVESNRESTLTVLAACELDNFKIHEVGLLCFLRCVTACVSVLLTCHVPHADNGTRAERCSVSGDNQ